MRKDPFPNVQTSGFIPKGSKGFSQGSAAECIAPSNDRPGTPEHIKKYR